MNDLPEAKRIQLEEAVKLYGQPKLLSREEAVAAAERGDKGLVALILDDDMLDDYQAFHADDPEAYRKENGVAEWTQEEPPTEEFQWMVPGWCWCSVNVLDRYLFPLPLPQNVHIEGIDFNLLEEECEVVNGTN